MKSPRKDKLQAALHEQMKRSMSRIDWPGMERRLSRQLFSPMVLDVLPHLLKDETIVIRSSR